MRIAHVGVDLELTKEGEKDMIRRELRFSAPLSGEQRALIDTRVST